MPSRQPCKTATLLSADACRFLFKVGKPTNFPLKKKDGEALSKMTLEEIETQFRCVTPAVLSCQDKS